MIAYMSNSNQQKEESSVTIEEQEVRDGHVSYSDNVRLIYMELLSMSVSVAKWSEVVRTVSTALTECQIDKLPTKSTTNGFQSECKTTANMHVADIILNSRDINRLCWKNLMTDHPIANKTLKDKFEEFRRDISLKSIQRISRLFRGTSRINSLNCMGYSVGCTFWQLWTQKQPRCLRYIKTELLHLLEEVEVSTTLAEKLATLHSVRTLLILMSHQPIDIVFKTGLYLENHQQLPHMRIRKGFMSSHKAQLPFLKILIKHVQHTMLCPTAQFWVHNRTHPELVVYIIHGHRIRRRWIYCWHQRDNACV